MSPQKIIRVLMWSLCHQTNFYFIYTVCIMFEFDLLGYNTNLPDALSVKEFYSLYRY
uniref:Uncharacterized protein n=1 Tax=Candidatus Kentrum sp. FW TaxID=2126338 RepID=A0A450TR68_9GAMM|nr:MAG: hypothetical protein BECKFW1821B_GA0114236_11943 [Candidatus Kentron sp. FW]